LSDTSPVFSLDGRSLAFIRIQAYSVSDVFALRLTVDLRPEREPERVTFLNESIAGLAWAPQGHDLVFSSGGSPGTTRLYRVRADALARQGRSNFCHSANTRRLSRLCATALWFTPGSSATPTSG